MPQQIIIFMVIFSIIVVALLAIIISTFFIDYWELIAKLFRNHKEIPYVFIDAGTNYVPVVGKLINANTERWLYSYIFNKERHEVECFETFDSSDEIDEKTREVIKKGYHYNGYPEKYYKRKRLVFAEIGNRVAVGGCSWTDPLQKWDEEQLSQGNYVYTNTEIVKTLKGKTSNGLIAIIAIAGILILIVGGVLLYTNSRKTSSEATPTSIVSPVPERTPGGFQIITPNGGK